MKNEIFNVVTVKDLKTDTAAILNVFSEMVAGRLNYDLSLLNYYDEVPISYASHITSVEQDSVEMSVHEHQALIIKYNNSTLIRCPHFHNGLDVHCYAAYVNVQKKTVILHNFAYAQIRAARREAVRVKVHAELPVEFTYEDGYVEGTIVDISGNGMLISTDLLPALTSDQPGELRFMLNDSHLSVPASFVNSSDERDGKKSCMFKIKPGRISDRIIGHFIYQRQVEIIQQLRDGLIVDD